MITAMLADGPCAGSAREVAVVEGRPPKVIDVDGPGEGTSRYCLAGWKQAGHSAVYSFLYEV